MTMTPNRSAMTLVEIMAVVVILGLLAVTLTVSLVGKMGKAKHEIAKTAIGQIAGQVQLYLIEQHKLPSASDGLAVLTSPATAPYYLEPAKLIDPWGKPYLYLVPGPAGQPFEVLTYGADGQPGGTGENADVSSTNLGEVKP